MVYGWSRSFFLFFPSKLITSFPNLTCATHQSHPCTGCLVRNSTHPCRFQLSALSPRLTSAVIFISLPSSVSFSSSSRLDSKFQPRSDPPPFRRKVSFFRLIPVPFSVSATHCPPAGRSGHRFPLLKVLVCAQTDGNVTIRGGAVSFFFFLFV